MLNLDDPTASAEDKMSAVMGAATIGCIVVILGAIGAIALGCHLAGLF